VLSVEDRLEIDDVLSLYCLALDGRDLAALAEVFTEDVECFVI